MKYIIPEGDYRLCLREGFGPFSEESHALVVKMSQTRPTGAPSQFNLSLVRKRNPYHPKFIAKTPYVFLIRCDLVSQEVEEFLSDCLFGTADMGIYGTFFVFGYKVLGQKFQTCVDYQNSEFLLINGISMWRETGPKIFEKIDGANNFEEMAVKRTMPYPLDLVIGKNIKTKSPWPAEFFVFDGQLYVSEKWDLNKSGLVPSKNECELDIHDDD